MTTSAANAVPADLVRRFITAACLRYNGDDRAFRFADAAALVREHRASIGGDFYGALVAGDLGAVRACLDGDTTLATRNGGPLEWPPLLYVTYSRVPAEREHVVGIMQLLLEHGASADSYVMVDSCRFTALTGAMGEGERGPVDCPPHAHADALVAALLAAGADPNESQGLYNTMFTASIEKWLPLFLERGLTAAHKCNWNPGGAVTTCEFFLAQAVLNGKVGLVTRLLAHGANPNCVSPYNGKSCHTNALLTDRPDIAALLVSHGATALPLSAADSFRLACWQGDRASATGLLDHNPELVRDAVLFHDIALQNFGVTRWLVERGFDINGRTMNGRTLLHRYAYANNVDIIRELLALGADPNLTEYTWQATPLGFALHDRAWSVAELLVNHTSSLLDACRAGHAARVRQLLAENPRRVHERTSLGNTPLHVVSEARESDPDVLASAALIDVLLASGADLDARNNAGETALDRFVNRGMHLLAGVLRQRAAGQTRPKPH